MSWGRRACEPLGAGGAEVSGEGARAGKKEGGRALAKWWEREAGDVADAEGEEEGAEASETQSSDAMSTRRFSERSEGAVVAPNRLRLESKMLERRETQGNQ